MFSRNVLREVRELQQERPSALSWLRQFWQIPVAAACVIVFSFGLLSSRDDDLAMQLDPDRLLVMAERVSDSPDYMVISHLDELLDSEENSVWLDQTVY